MNDSEVAIDNLVARAGQLYSLPAVAMKVLELTDDPRLDTRALKECIENDPALTGKLLRVVNSSLFGLSSEVSDLNQALALLGTKPLKLLVLGFSLPRGLFADVSGDILGWYWRHTLTRAVAAREIAETVFDVPGDEAFIAGLLQDLGMLMLVQQLGETYVRFLEKVISTSKNLAALETELMGFNHTAASAKLLAKWRLPETLVEAIAAQSSNHRANTLPSPEKNDNLPQILHLAELLAQVLADGQSQVLGKLLQTSQRYRGLREIPLETLVEKLEEKVRQLADVLSLQLPDGLDYRDVLVEAHGKLSEVSADVAGEMLHLSQGEAPQSEEDRVLTELRYLAKAVAEVSERPPQSTGVAEKLSEIPSPPAPLPASRARGEGGTVTATATADPALLRQLSEASAACRQSRCPLSLLLIQFDGVAELRLTRGLSGFAELRRFLETACREVDHLCAICSSHGEAGFALVLPDCERRPAVELATQLIETVRRLDPGGAGGNHRAVSISAGVATLPMPPRNCLAENLFTAANRCLYGALSSGGGVAKSIEIYQ